MGENGHPFDRHAAMPDLVLYLLPLLIGAALGFAGGVFGIGGGVIAIPVLTNLFAMDQKLAQGTALVMMVPNLALALWRYHQRRPLPLGRTAGLVAAAMTMTALTAQYASQLPSADLRRYFGAFLLWLGVQALWSLRGGGRRWKLVLPERALPLVGAIGGTCQGLIAIGGGMIAVPLLTGLFRQPQALAQGFALALVMPSSAIALATFGQAGLVDWRMGVLLALGGAVSVSAGVRLAHGLPERRLRVAFSLMLLFTGLWMLVRG